MTDVPIEPGAEVRMELGEAVLTFISDFIDQRESSPASFGPIDPALVEELMDPPGEAGVELPVLLDRLQQATNTGFDSASGRSMSFVPSGGLYTAALGTFLGSAINRYTGGSHAAPGAVAIEQSVVDWMTSLFGLPASGGGLLLSGGSIANLTAVVTARSQLGDAFHDGVVYTSERAHHSIDKATRIAGIAPNRMRAVPTDADLRLDPKALKQAIRADRGRGLRPLMIVATAGTTDTGAVDPLAVCAEIAEAEGTWFHIDAAYGGFFQLTDRGRTRLTGIDRADSITVDAHKSLLLPFGIGGLLVRDPATLIGAHEGHGAYLRDVTDGELPHFLAMGPELTRPNRGLPVWLALHLHGVAQFRATLDRMLDLADDAADQLEGLPGVALAGRPELSIVAFRALAGDAATLHVLDVLNRSGEVHVSSTTIGGHVYVRLAFLSQRTTEEMAARAIELIREAVTS